MAPVHPFSQPTLWKGVDMIGPISGVYAKEQNSNSQEQEIVLIELQPRPRWPRYTFLLVLAGILGVVACAYYYLRPVSIGEIVEESHCGKPVSTWGIVYFEAPGFKEINGKRRGYWLKDTNEFGFISGITVFYDPEKMPSPALGQALKVSGILECNGWNSPERVAIGERYRRVQ